MAMKKGEGVKEKINKVKIQSVISIINTSEISYSFNSTGNPSNPMKHDCIRQKSLRCLLLRRWGANILWSLEICSSWFISLNSSWNSSKLANCKYLIFTHQTQSKGAFDTDSYNASSSNYNLSWSCQDTNLPSIKEVHEHEEFIQIVLGKCQTNVSKFAI